MSFDVNIVQLDLRQPYTLNPNVNIVQWDPRQGTDDSLVQEYIQHLGAVNTVNFIDGYRRVVSTVDLLAAKCPT